MRYDAEHKQKTRDRVLKYAARAIRAEGPHQVGVAGVMNKAGLTHGGFYAHFASKDEMIVAAIARMFEEVQSFWDEETRDRSDADGLAAYINRYLSCAHRDSTERGCPIAALATDLPRLPEPSREEFARGVHRLTTAIAAPLARMGHDDPDALAASVVSELVGTLALARAEPDAAAAENRLSSSRRMIKRRLGLETA